MRIEGGPYTPPAAVQYGIRAVRVAQGATGVFFFFGEQILAKLGRPPFEFMGEMHTNLIAHVAALYGLNMVADTLKSINAFEVVYNGQVLHSKLSSGKFPEPGEVAEKLAAVLGKATPRAGGIPEVAEKLAGVMEKLAADFGAPQARAEAAAEPAAEAPPEPRAQAA